MKIKKTTQDVIMSTKYLADYSNNADEIIKNICRTHILTQDFIREFSQYITPEIFMTSYKLPKSLADNNPHLFDETTFLELLKYKEEELELDENTALANKVNSMNNQMNGFMKQNGGNYITGAQLMQLTSSIGDPDEPRKVIRNNLKNISLSMLVEYYFQIKDNDEYRLTNSDIERIIRESENEDLEDESIINLMGITPQIDELLLKRIKNEDTKSSLLLTLSLSDDHTLTSSSYKYLSNDIKEEMLGTEDVSMKEFVNALAESKDLGWQQKLINNAINREIKFEKSTKSFENELILLCSNLPEDLIVKLSKFSNMSANSFSYRVMFWLLENKDFSEDQLIEMKDLFKKAGMFINLKKHAKDNSFDKLIQELSK